MSVRRITLHGAAILAIAFFAFMAISSTATPAMVYDESVPPEESVNFYFYDGVEIREYNGIPVPKKYDSSTSESTWRNVILPAGEIKFVMDVSGSVSTGVTVYTFTYRNVAITYTFEPGESYIVHFSRIDDIRIISDRSAKQTKWAIKIGKGDYRSSVRVATYPISDLISNSEEGGIILE
jgi:uncharacterized DUF497 family protein